MRDSDNEQVAQERMPEEGIQGRNVAMRDGVSLRGLSVILEDEGGLTLRGFSSESEGSISSRSLRRLGCFDSSYSAFLDCYVCDVEAKAKGKTNAKRLVGDKYKWIQKIFKNRWNPLKVWTFRTSSRGDDSTNYGGAEACHVSTV